MNHAAAQRRIGCEPPADGLVSGYSGSQHGSHDMVGTRRAKNGVPSVMNLRIQQITAKERNAATGMCHTPRNDRYLAGCSRRLG